MARKLLIGSLAVFGLATFCGTVLAGDKDVTDFGKRKPTVAEVIDALKPKTADEGGAVTRSLRRDVPKSVSLELTFSTNSAALTPEAKSHLSAVGEALGSENLSGARFIVEGHADARGGDAYNKALSERRAAAVKSYLVSRYKVSSSKLEAVGKGKEELKDPANPESEVNRRVEIISVVGN